MGIKFNCRVIFLLLAVIAFSCLGISAQDNSYPAIYAKQPRFKALIYYTENAEEAHIKFARDAIDFFTRLTDGEGFILEVTTSLATYDLDSLKEFNTIIALNCSPSDPEERRLFETYMETGGGWLGFHAAAYNDKNTGWPWLNRFLGCGQFYCNNWPPQPALLEVEVIDSPVTKNLPTSFVAPATEWYQWHPSPRQNPEVEVMLSLSPKNYPFGLKDVVLSGDFPVVWRNSNYRMIYLNFGHGDRCFSDATQNLLTVNAFRYVVSLDPAGDPFLE
ncbi:MAG: ThuA domain-containing protein [Muribaculaceae bacterium]|nr:ThuA domain-containing protein [Muribaculaceae bacterium]